MVMNSVLIVSCVEKSTIFFKEILMQGMYNEINVVSSCGDARRLFIERDYDLCIINAPLSDEFGDDLAKVLSENCQVLLVVKAELYDEVSEAVENYGVFTLSKPISKALLWSALKLANAAYSRMMMIRNENRKLLQKIEDIRIVDRAKLILIQYLGMTEAQAHKYIERQAMDMRMTRKAVAEGVLKTYEP